MKHLRTFNESEKFLEIDLSILKDIYCDLADKHNINYDYVNFFNINYKTNSLTIRYEFYSVPNISYVNANYKKLLFLPEN